MLAAGATATFFTCFAISPFETVRIRMVECPGYATNLLSALQRFLKEGGFASLYDGENTELSAPSRVANPFVCRQRVIITRCPHCCQASQHAGLLPMLLLTQACGHRSHTAPPSSLPHPPRSPTFLTPLDIPLARSPLAGIIPLLLRQIVFGMIKFLVFDTCADALLAALPADASESTVVSLGVSLLSGVIAGTCAAVVSQPADVILSKVAQGDGSSASVGRLPGSVNQLALLQQAASSIQRSGGMPAFFRGLPSRCLWSSAIIGGQFFLYDLFKAALHITAADLGLFYDALGASAAFAPLVAQP